MPSAHEDFLIPGIWLLYFPISEEHRISNVNYLSSCGSTDYYMNISEINRKKVLIRWNNIHESEKKFIFNHASKHRHLKARIHGYLCGDGSVSRRKEIANGKVHNEIRFYPDHITMASSFLDAFNQVYGKRLRMKERKNHYLVSVNSKIIVNDLLKDGPFSSMNWHVPDWVMRDQENAKEWLRAFFDSEAYVNAREIRVQSVNRMGLHQVKIMLERFGISSGEYSYKRKNNRWNINYHLVISGQVNRCNFLKRVGFNHIKKLNRLLDADVA